MYCEKCGAQFAQGAKFCAQCGSPRSTTAPVIKPFHEATPVAPTRIAQLVDDGETYDPRYGHDQVATKSAGWTPPGFRRGRNGPRIFATITYALLAWGSLRTIGHLVAGLFYVGGTGLAIALWYDYRGLRSRVFAKPGRPWFTSGALVTVAALAWFAARGLDQTPQASTAARIASEPVIMATNADPAIQSSHDEATALLGEARIKRDAGEFGLALELARQAQAKWPGSTEIKTYLAETGIQATAGMKTASAQTTAQSKAAAEADAREKAAAAAEAKRAEQSQLLAKAAEDRKTFLKLINTTSGASALVQSVRQGDGDPDELEITVKNIWFVLAKGLRLQHAQTLWQVWARIHSPGNLDRSRIQLIDANGNRLGGSGFLGGSTVSVSD